MFTRHNINHDWIGMMAALAFAGAALSASGVSMDAPAAPTNALSAMWTLENIYNVLDTRTTNVTKRTGGFTEPAGLPTNGTMHTLNDIMTLVTNRAPVQKTGQTKSYATGDNGWCGTNYGVAWPTNRFTIGTNTTDQPNDTNCVVDNLTGLMWARNASLFASTNWGTAVTNCNDLVYGGYDDWRMPNLRELYSLICYLYITPALPSGHPFAGVQAVYYWTSTSVWNDANRAFYIDLNVGTVYHDVKSPARPVWPVRGGGD